MTNMIDLRLQQREQFVSLMEDYRLVTLKLDFLDKEGGKILEELMRIQREILLLYKKVIE